MVSTETTALSMVSTAFSTETTGLSMVSTAFSTETTGLSMVSALALALTMASSREATATIK